jgi:hypothetical protein
MISGEFKGEMPEEMMKKANDMVQGSCPNWANAGQVYAMFEAGRMAARNFARSQSARGQQRTGD